MAPSPPGCAPKPHHQSVRNLLCPLRSLPSVLKHPLPMAPGELDRFVCTSLRHPRHTVQSDQEVQQALSPFLRKRAEVGSSGSPSVKCGNICRNRSRGSWSWSLTPFSLQAFPRAKRGHGQSCRLPPFPTWPNQLTCSSHAPKSGSPSPAHGRKRGSLCTLRRRMLLTMQTNQE